MQIILHMNKTLIYCKLLTAFKINAKMCTLTVTSLMVIWPHIWYYTRYYVLYYILKIILSYPIHQS